MRLIHRTFLIALIVLLTAGCKYQKLLKDGTPVEKLTAAKNYYNKGDYTRALPLLQGLQGSRRQAGAEEIYYYFAYTYYGMGDFITAAYRFKNFTENFPRSKYTEEAAFMSAKCAYHQSLPPYLDQTNTRSAIEKIQLFINKHPGSDYVDDGNELIDELRGKLHEKTYSNAMLYYKMGYYKSSFVAFKNAIADYPDLPEKDELEYLVVKSAYQYAQNSFQSVQGERYQIALDEAELFLEGDVEKESYKKEVKEILTKSVEAIRRLNESKVLTSGE